MKTNCYYKSEALSKAVYVLCLAFIMLSLSCKKDNEGGGYFELKDNPTSLTVSAQGASETFTVQSSGAWKVEPLRNERWVKIEPSEGNGSGTFTVTIDRNTALEARQSVLTFVVDGRIQNNVLKIEQAARSANSGDSDPYLYLDGLSSLQLPEEGVNGRYTVRSTGDWRIEIVEGENWLNINPMEGRFDTGVTMSVGVNASEHPRTGKFVFYLDGEPVPGEFVVNQVGMEVILFEDFSWLNYGSEIFGTTTGETQMNSWTAEQKAKGWTSTTNTTEGVGSTPFSTYARIGFVKLGRTSYGSDIISPKLSAVQGTKNLVVTFKAVRYASGDHNLLTVGVKGPGTASVSQFNVTNLANPNSSLEACRAAWQAPEAKYSFIITGATSETQVWFLGGAFDQRSVSGWPATVNRIFLDDILVAVKK